MGREIHLALYRCRESVRQGESATLRGAATGGLLDKVRLVSMLVGFLTIAPRCVAGETNNVTTNFNYYLPSVSYLPPLLSTNPVGARAKGGFGAEPPAKWVFLSPDVKVSTGRTPTLLEDESDPTRTNFKLRSAPERLGDYWLPGEFQRIMDKPRPITPLSPKPQ